jgi:hypothetical protein
MWNFQAKETWPRLQQIDPSLSILKEPTSLMKLVSTYTATNLITQSEDIHSTVETRHEAVRGLLDLQKTKFGVRLKKSSRGSGIDHVYITEEPASANVFLRIVATPSKHADILARDKSDCDYWSMEQLDFDKDGRLIGRTAYVEP